MKSAILLILSVITLCAQAGTATFTWDQNTEINIDHYTLYRAANGGGPVGTVIGFPTNRWTYTDVSPGNTYVLFVTATSTAALESAPSTNLTFIPPFIAPPVDILSVRPGGQSSGNWTAVAVTYSPINLATYQAAGVTITAVPQGGGTTLTWLAVSSPLVIPSLPIHSYTFSASVVNASGTSGPGATKFLDGTAPAQVKNLQIQVGP